MILATTIGLQACRSGPAPEVIAADGVLCDITQHLAAGDLRVGCLLQPGDDPHQFRLTPRQSRELNGVRLLLINGYGLTPALARPAGIGKRAVAVAERAVPDSPNLKAPNNEHPGHSQGNEHHHGDRDPHVWHDPSQASAMVQLVARQLEGLKPTAQRRIATRAQSMTTVLGQLDTWNRQQLAPIPGARPLATGHRAFASLARAYGLRELPLVDANSSSGSLRPQTVQAVVDQLQRDKVPMLFPEVLPANKALLRISALSGVPLASAALVADGLAPTAAGSSSSLVATLTRNTCLIAEGLGGRCDRAGAAKLDHRWRTIGL